MGYVWSGNVRELEHAMERAMILCPGEEVRPEDLPPEVRPSHESPSGGRTLAEAEREHILKTLESCGGDEAQAAKRLGITPRALKSKVKGYGDRP
jgi:DNA-binding NtrC family response regulator